MNRDKSMASPGMPLCGNAVAGFTVIETLVALTLLAAAAGFLMATLGTSSRLVRDVRENETALWLARSRLVEAAAYPDRSPPQDDRPDQFEGVDYRTRIEYREISPLPEIDIDKVARAFRLIEIRVLVSWGARPSTVQLTAYRKTGPETSVPPAPGK
ncbi:MAG: hypothetical protein D4R84_11980 [Rhodocyclaceae bacterium]|nr:MAG: hypothetical protein D4R84_11980 [Rhodocyclaceae bacterium]